MLDNCKDNAERWNAVEAVLQNWLRERRDILVRYTAIATNLNITEHPPKLDEGLRGLCELLVDYVSAGHFEVFYELIREAEAFADGSSKQVGEMIARITETTEVILGFDERYPADMASDIDPRDDLSKLGEALEIRFELEDQLIARLHKAHAGAVAAQ